MKKLVILGLFIFSSSVFAQDVMTFKDCLDLTLKDNLDLKNALNSSQIAKFQYKASYGKLLPNVFGSLDNKNSWGREINPNTNLFVNTDVKNYVGYINANYNLFAGFSVLNTIKLNKQELNINKSNVQRVQNEITISLAEKFITILFLQEIISANQAQINSSQSQIELASLKFESGVIPESDVFKIKAQKAQEELDLLTNQNRLVDNMISLKQLMNFPIEKEIILVKPILTLDPNVKEEENQYDIVNRVLEINPTYSMSLYRQKKARAALGLARSARYPVLSLRAQYGSNYTNIDVNELDEITPFKDQISTNEINVLRFNLIVPLFTQLDNFSKIRTSKLLYKQAKIDREISKNELTKEVLKAVNDAKTSVKKNEASTKALDFSQKSYQADTLKFELGKINSGELNVTKNNFNNSQAQLIQSKYELMYKNALIKFYLGEAFTL